MAVKIYEEADAKAVNARKDRIQRIRDKKRLDTRNAIAEHEELREMARIERDYYEL